MIDYKSAHVIGCGVLKCDLPDAIKRTGVEAGTEYLDGGLHAVPNELRRRLQLAIDAASRSGKVERIIIGYGICGKGSEGIHARNVPLFIPKVHDCIALFLGSDKRYHEEFANNPGTYYISAGWFEENVQPKGKKIFVEKSRDETLRNKSFDYFKERYGEENAAAITRFYNSWQKNYKRSAFIDTGAGEREKYHSYAQSLADEFDWEYKELEGTTTLLEQMLTAVKGTNEILYVPPEHVTRFNAVTKSLIAVPLWDRSTENKKKERASKKSRNTADTDVDKGPSPPSGSKKRRMGLGIDAGGTYTDAAIYDFTTKKVRSKAKALTTKWDFTLGINEAIDKLDPATLTAIDLVSVSTTLATNAIVEGHGQKVGLILMPSQVFDPKKIENKPSAVIKGRLTISGKEVEPIDEKEIRRVAAEMKTRDKVTVFAVSGYGGSVNPVHELAAKEIIIRETGLYVCCGHELSDLLNYYVRANTAVLNARIIPLLEQFIYDVEQSLQHRGIDIPIMVVKGNGSLMSTELARYRPIETILSGPAASISGARYLTDREDAIVIDVGGTTSDIGCISGGSVEICPQGAAVGGWRTHVKALNMSTVGLGGDSAIQIEEQNLHIGPRRIAPMAWLASRADLTKPIRYLRNHIDYFLSTTKPMQFFTITDSGEKFELTKEEVRIMEALKQGPCSLLELAERTGAGHWMMLHTSRLEGHYLIARCGLTPTDLLHVEGKLTLWDWKLAREIAELTAGRIKISLTTFIERVFEKINNKITEELIKKQLGLDLEDEKLNSSLPWQIVMSNIIDGGSNKRMQLEAQFVYPVIGLGAPVHFFLERLNRTIEGEVIVPPHAEVANAIGAITSSVTVTKRLHIVANAEGRFSLQGLSEQKQFDTFEEANTFAEETVKQEVLRMARTAGTSEEYIDLDIDDRITKTADGSELFLERILEATVTGIPDLVQ
jgi:N-methylhydantoinase A/oxoprolinase/acetone carboxylase beta subunit